MKYKSEVTIQKDYVSDPSIRELKITHHKKDASLKIGEMIGRIATWQEVDDETNIKYTLEVEAFSIGDWMEFKREIKYIITQCESSEIATTYFMQIAELINKLEQKGIEKSIEYNSRKYKNG